MQSIPFGSLCATTGMNRVLRSTQPGHRPTVWISCLQGPILPTRDSFLLLLDILRSGMPPQRLQKAADYVRRFCIGLHMRLKAW